MVEEEEDGVIYTVVVKQQHGGPASPVVRRASARRIGHAGKNPHSVNISFFLSPCSCSPSSLQFLAPSVPKQEQRRSWCSTSFTPFLWETLPSSPSSSPPIAPSPPRRECWTSSLTGTNVVSRLSLLLVSVVFLSGKRGGDTKMRKELG